MAVLWIWVHNSETQNNGSNMAERNNENNQIWMKPEMQKYRKILIWWNYRIFTTMLRHSFCLNLM